MAGGDGIAREGREGMKAMPGKKGRRIMDGIETVGGIYSAAGFWR
jgi:hypothetical protein